MKHRNPIARVVKSIHNHVIQDKREKLNNEIIAKQINEANVWPPYYDVRSIMHTYSKRTDGSWWEDI